MNRTFVSGVLTPNDKAKPLFVERLRGANKYLITAYRDETLHDDLKLVITIDPTNDTEELMHSLIQVLGEDMEDGFDNVVDEVYEFCQMTDIYDFCSDYRHMYLTYYHTNKQLREFMELLFTAIIKAYTDGILLGLNPKTRQVLIEDCIDLMDMEAVALTVMVKHYELALHGDGEEQYVLPQSVINYTDSPKFAILRKQLEDEAAYPDYLFAFLTSVSGQCNSVLFNNLMLNVDNESAPVSNIMGVDSNGHVNISEITDRFRHLFESQPFLHLDLLCNTIDENLEDSFSKYKIPEEGVRVVLTKEDGEIELSYFTLKEWESKGHHVLTISSTNYYGETSVNYIDLKNAKYLISNCNNIIDALGMFAAMGWLGMLDETNIRYEQVAGQIQCLTPNEKIVIGADHEEMVKVLLDALNGKTRAIVEELVLYNETFAPQVLVGYDPDFDYEEELNNADKIVVEFIH